MGNGSSSSSGDSIRERVYTELKSEHLLIKIITENSAGKCECYQWIMITYYYCYSRFCLKVNDYLLQSIYRNYIYNFFINF